MKAMKYMMSDGMVIEGGSADEIVAGMSGTKMSEPRSIESYRKAVARRVKGVTERRIRTDTNEAFLADMEECGLIEQVQ